MLMKEKNILKREAVLRNKVCVLENGEINNILTKNLRDTIPSHEGRGERKTKTTSYVYQNKSFQQGFQSISHQIQQIQNKK